VKEDNFYADVEGRLRTMKWWFEKSTEFRWWSPMSRQWQTRLGHSWLFPPTLPPCVARAHMCVGWHVYRYIQIPNSRANRQLVRQLPVSGPCSTWSVFYAGNIAWFTYSFCWPLNTWQNQMNLRWYEPSDLSVSVTLSSQPKHISSAPINSGFIGELDDKSPQSLIVKYADKADCPLKRLNGKIDNSIRGKQYLKLSQSRS